MWPLHCGGDSFLLRPLCGSLLHTPAEATAATVAGCDGIVAVAVMSAPVEGQPREARENVLASGFGM